MDFDKIKDGTKEFFKDKGRRIILNPVNDMVDESLTEVVTTIGSFIIKAVQDRLQTSIQFKIGLTYSDHWMEEALYGILYEYNTIKQKGNLRLSNAGRHSDGSGLYYKLGDGIHPMKYKKWNIVLIVETQSNGSVSGRISESRTYTVTTYAKESEKFVNSFEKDMVKYRNSLIKIKADSPVVNVYTDAHEGGHGYTYWMKSSPIHKRKLNTVYLPIDTKKQIVDTINSFFKSEADYRRHGIAHNLKILLYGNPGPQPHSIMIPTPQGIRKFGDLKVGDEVFALNGLPTPILEIYEQGELDVYEVEFNDGRKVLCGAEHEWPTITYGGAFQNRSVQEMLSIGVLTGDLPNFRIPLNDIATYPHQKIPLDPWLIGVFLANKNALDKENLTIASPDAIIPKIICVKTGFDMKRRSDNPNDTIWCFYNKDGSPVKTREFFKEVEELHKGERVIPKKYMYNTRSIRFSLIQGLMDMDGSVHDRNVRTPDKGYDISYTSTSNSLLEEMKFVINSLGFTASIIIDDRIKEYNPDYAGTLHIYASNLDKYLFFSRSHHKIDKVHKAKYQMNNISLGRDHTPVIMITGITKLDRKENMRCLHVEDRLHIYLTTDFIPTCNCGKDTIAKMIASEWNRNLYYVTGGKGGKFIPEAITSDNDDVQYPLFLISDIDKYPFLINDTNVNLEDIGVDDRENKLDYKQAFGRMINALDGVMSGEGRIIIMTTNHIEKFSKVFLRPGRIDLLMEIGYVTPWVFRKYVKDFFEVELPENIKLKNNKLTIATLQFDIRFLKLTADEFVNKYVK